MDSWIGCPGGAKVKPDADVLALDIDETEARATATPHGPVADK